MRSEIVGAEDITPAWLTAVLAEAGVGSGAEIEGFETRSIGTGQVGENVRFTLRWSSDDPELPASVVGKFPSRNELSRATAALTGTYVREVGFYRDLADSVTVRSPRVHHVAGDVAANDFVVIMEDIAPAEQGDQLAGCTVEQAELAVDEAAGLHGSTWDQVGRLTRLEWIGQVSEERTRGRADLYAAVFDGFAARYESAMSRDDIELGRAMTSRLIRLGELQVEGPGVGERWSLVHGDYRLDNLLFGTGPGAPPVTVVDWQTVTVGPGPSDVAYLLGSGLIPELREQQEERLVRRYVERLAEHGVSVEFDDIWRRYVLGSFSGYLMAVTASQIVEQTERGDAMFVAMAVRHAAQVRHLGLLDLLDS
jgi:hypothetical protein